MPFAAPWMDLEIIILSEVNQTETNIISFIEGILKKWYKWTYLQNRNRLTDIENKTIIIKEDSGGRDGRDKLWVWNQHIHTTIYKIDNQRGPTV